MRRDHRLLPGAEGDDTSSPRLAVPIDAGLTDETGLDTGAHVAIHLPGDDVDPGGLPTTAPQQSVNVRLLLVLLILGVTSAAAMVGLREYQMSRLSRLYLERAQRAEEDERPHEALKYLRQYLSFQPDNMAVRVRLVLLLESLAESPRDEFEAAMTMERLLHDAPDQHEVRRLLVDLMMGLGRYGDARAHLGFLLGSTPNSPDLHLLMGRCQDLDGHHQAAAAAYQTAIQLRPRNIDTYQFLARLLREKAEQPNEADRVIDQMVARNRDNFQAYLARGQYRRGLGQQNEAAVDVRRAFQLAPDEVDVLVAIAGLLSDERQSGGNSLAARFDIDSTRARVKQNLARQPDRIELLGALAALEWADGRTQAAEEALRQAMQISSKNTELPVLLIQLLLANGKVDEAQAELGRLKPQDVGAAAISYLEGRILIAQERWLEAARLLEPIRPSSLPFALRGPFRLDLGECYHHLGHVPRRLETLRSAVESDQHSSAARAEYAAALAASGRIVDALGQLRQVPPTSAIRMQIAQLLLLQQMTLATENRKWDDIEETLTAAAGDPGNQPGIMLLRAEMLVAQSKLPEAEKLLEQACERLPARCELRLGWARMVRTGGRPERALEIIDQTEEQFGQREEILLERIVHWKDAGAAEARAELAKLRGIVGGLPPGRRLRPQRALAEALAELGDDDAAETLWSELSELAPHDLTIALARFDAALRSNSLERAEALIADIRRIEGDDGAYWRLADATRLLELAGAGADRDAQLTQARQLLERVETLLPASPRVSLAIGRVDELQGNKGAAARRYTEAIDRGERRQDVARHAIRLLYDAGRYDDAQKLLKRLAEQGTIAISGEIGELGINVSLRAHNYESAVQIAQQEADRDPLNAEKRLSLGRVLHVAKRPEDAERELRKARSISADSPDVAVALVEFLAAIGKESDALAEIDDVRRQFPADEAPLTLARCYQAVGQMDQAVTYFESALEKRPDDSGVVLQAAEFYLKRNDAARAHALLLQIDALGTRAAAADAAAARRARALLLVGKGTYGALQQAIALLPESTRSSLPADLHVQAVVLAVSPHREHHRTAVNCLERLAEQRKLSADEQRLMTDLQLKLDNWRQASDSLLALVIGHGDNLEHLAYGVRTMLEHDDFSRLTREWLASLANKAPGHIQTVELEIWGLVMQSRAEEAAGRIDAQLSQLADDAPRRAALANRFADVLSRLGERRELAGRTLEAESLFKAAERLYRDNVRNDPPRVLALLQFLGRRLRQAEALALLEQAWKSCPPEAVAAACVDLLRRGRAERKAFDQVRGQLLAAMRQFPDSAVLLLHAGSVAQLDGDFETATALYRAAVLKNAALVPALNELAVLLALHGRTPEPALEAINRAIEVAGPLPELLDTRAMVYVQLKQSTNAVKDLTQALLDAPTPVTRFHLAQALMQSGEKQAAQSELARAIADGLHSGMLHPLEREAFRNLQAAADDAGRRSPQAIAAGKR